MENEEELLNEESTENKEEKRENLEKEILEVLANESKEQALEEPAPIPEPKKGSVGIRVATGVIIGVVYTAVILLTVFFSRPYQRIAFDIFVIGIALVASLEVWFSVSKKFARPFLVIILLNLILGFAAFFVMHFVLSPRLGEGGRLGGITAFFLVMLVMVIVLLFINVFSRKHTLSHFLSTLFIMVYPGILSIYMLSLNYFNSVFVSNSAIFLLILVPAFSDTFAFITGSIFKGPKLAPKISPKKTISGALGGVFGGVFAAIIVFLFAHFGVLNFGGLSERVGLNVMHFILIGAIGSIFSIMGDLLASLLKRQCGVKDFGRTLPGHGGIMDRIDGMLLFGLFLFVYIYIIQLFA